MNPLNILNAVKELTEAKADNARLVTALSQKETELTTLQNAFQALAEKKKTFDAKLEAVTVDHTAALAKVTTDHEAAVASLKAEHQTAIDALNTQVAEAKDSAGKEAARLLA